VFFGTFVVNKFSKKQKAELDAIDKKVS